MHNRDTSTVDHQRHQDQRNHLIILFV